MINVLSEHSACYNSLSRLLRWFLQSLGGCTQLLTGSQADTFFARGNRSNYLCETYLTIDKTTDFQRPLHYQVCTRFGCASQSLTASWKLLFSMQHQERSIITVWSHLPITHLCECKNDGCTCMHIPSCVPWNDVNIMIFLPSWLALTGECSTKTCVCLVCQLVLL